MKSAINVILGLCAAALLYICYSSIHDTEEVDEQIKLRENVVKNRLIDIRHAQESYKLVNNEYCDDWEIFTDFVKNGVVADVKREGTVTDEFADLLPAYYTPDQLDQWTESERNLMAERLALALKASGNPEALEQLKKTKMERFSRDTTWVPVAQYIRENRGKKDFAKSYSLDSISYIPFSNVQFELETGIKAKSGGEREPTMMCSAPVRQYFSNMGRLGDRAIMNLEKQAENNKLDENAYAGLRIGGPIERWNENAGNWE